MKNIINKFFAREKNRLKVETTFSADEIKPIFESHGINIENIGFPCISERHYVPDDAYFANFKNVKITPVKINGNISTIIEGKYIAQAKLSYQDSMGWWKPGNPMLYNFKIQEGKLNINRIN